MDIFDVILQDLKTLFEVRLFINGKVDMQKSLYFMKELGYTLPFNYRWSKLGPYSYELANFIDRLTVQGYLQYSGRYDLDERHLRNVQPNIKPQMKKFFNSLEKTCNENSFNQVDFIECAASLHFLHKYSNIKSKEELFKRVEELKPERIPAFENLREDALIFLKQNNLI